MIPALRRSWFRWQLRKALAKDTQPHAFVPFDQAKRILLLVMIDNPESVSITQQWVKQWGANRDITLLGYHPSRKKLTFEIPFPHLTPKNLSFGYHPKSDIDWQQPVDALLCVTPHMHYAMAYIAAHAKATMRVGPHNSTYEPCLDLMVSLPENTPSLDTIFNTFDRYLKMIRSHEPNQ